MFAVQVFKKVFGKMYEKIEYWFQIVVLFVKKCFCYIVAFSMHFKKSCINEAISLSQHIPQNIYMMNMKMYLSITSVTIYLASSLVPQILFIAIQICPYYGSLNQTVNKFGRLKGRSIVIKTLMFMYPI